MTKGCLKNFLQLTCDRLRHATRKPRFATKQHITYIRNEWCLWHILYNDKIPIPPKVGKKGLISDFYSEEQKYENFYTYSELVLAGKLSMDGKDVIFKHVTSILAMEHVHSTGHLFPSPNSVRAKIVKITASILCTDHRSDLVYNCAYVCCKVKESMIALTAFAVNTSCVIDRGGNLSISSHQISRLSINVSYQTITCRSH